MNKQVKRQFPALGQKVHGRSLIYFDTAASALKPAAVIKAESDFLKKDYANVHRGLYVLAERATQAFEGARLAVAKFIGATSAEIVFTKNATEGLNILAQGLARVYLKKGDRVVLSALEHHANLVPWQQLAKTKGFKIDYLPLHKNGEVDLKQAEKIIKKCQVVSVTALSNVLGNVLPLLELGRLAKQSQAIFIVDACQMIGVRPFDVKKIGCQAAVFSSHKIYGPSGLGVLYAKAELIKNLPPLIYGGQMIKNVSLQKTEFKDTYEKFEAGTPPISQTVGLVAAVKFIEELGRKNIWSHQHVLGKMLSRELRKLPFIKVAGQIPEKNQAGIVSFYVPGLHAHDVATYLDQFGIAARAGWHCAEPLIKEGLNLPPLVRVSVGVYNTEADVKALISALKKMTQAFKL